MKVWEVHFRACVVGVNDSVMRSESKNRRQSFMVEIRERERDCREKEIGGGECGMTER